MQITCLLSFKKKRKKNILEAFYSFGTVAAVQL
jgi:hypothetical protein